MSFKQGSGLRLFQPVVLAALPPGLHHLTNLVKLEGSVVEERPHGACGKSQDQSQCSPLGFWSMVLAESRREPYTSEKHLIESEPYLNLSI